MTVLAPRDSVERTSLAGGSAPASSRRQSRRPEPGLRLSQHLRERLRCPACGSPLALGGDRCACLHRGCAKRFAVAGGVAILIDEESSVFSPRQALSRLPARPETFRQRLPKLLRNLLPALGSNPVARHNVQAFRRLLLEQNPQPSVLVVGGASVGVGMASLLGDSRIECVESDVWHSERTHLVCDAHQIPFAENTFDGVVIQAVLEHVADPERCVNEIHRVLRPDGLIYAETAFMQQVHAGRHDFCRFTAVGHRRLFGGFEQIAAGAAGGPGVALAWAWQHFLLSFTAGRTGRAVATGIAALTAFWLKYLDSYLLEMPAALDAASSFFFLGARREIRLTDREAIAVYPGAQTDAV
jgi:SAM-dependent methyltransferase